MACAPLVLSAISIITAHFHLFGIGLLCQGMCHMIGQRKNCLKSQESKPNDLTKISDFGLHAYKI